MLSPQQQVTIERIARRHGVLLGNNDPILMVQTMLDCAQEEIEQQQATSMRRFSENVETVLYKVQEHSVNVLNKAYQHSEAVINKSLDAAQQALKQSTDESFGRMTREVADVLAALDAARQLQQRATIACVAGAVGILALFVLEALRAGGIL